MKLILLNGNKNCGKTTTLIMLYNLLTGKMKKKPKKNPIFNKKDFHCVFTYKKKTIAIVTTGDTLLIILKMIFLYIYVDCLIIAYNTGTPTKENILTCFKQKTNFKKTVCKKSVSKTVKYNANLKDCKKIINAI